jgi:hypothetical protein
MYYILVQILEVTMHCLSGRRECNLFMHAHMLMLFNFTYSTLDCLVTSQAHSSLTYPATESVIGQVQCLQQWHAIAQICWYVAKKLVVISNEVLKPVATAVLVPANWLFPMSSDIRLLEIVLGMLRVVMFQVH